MMQYDQFRIIGTQFQKEIQSFPFSGKNEKLETKSCSGCVLTHKDEEAAHGARYKDVPRQSYSQSEERETVRRTLALTSLLAILILASQNAPRYLALTSVPTVR